MPFSTWAIVAGALLAAVLVIHFLSRPFLARGRLEFRAKLEAWFAPSHEYRAASLDDFPGLDRAFYERATAELEALQFRVLGDVENVTLARADGDRRTCIRLFASKDGAVLAAVYDTGFRGLLGTLRRLGLASKAEPSVVFKTELGDSRTIVTSTDPGAAQLDPPPGTSVSVSPRATPAAELLETHRKRVAVFSDENPGVAARTVGSIEDAIAAQNRHQARKHAQRRSLGWLTDEEIERAFPRRTWGLVRGIRDEMRRAGS